MRKKKIDAANVIMAVLFLGVLYPLALVVVWLWNLADIITNQADYYEGTVTALIALLSAAS